MPCLGKRESQEGKKMYEAWAFAKTSPDSKFQRIKVKRGATGPDDVEFDIKYCGICHTDVHIAQNEMAPFLETNYPCVPGHELAGIVTKVGKNVKRFKVGDKVGVGCMVDSCKNCEACADNSEQYCEEGHTATYNGKTKEGRISTDSGHTYGGYSSKISVNQDFVIKVPANFPIEYAGPILCAGITMFSPLKHWEADKKKLNVGIIGVGGLGQMGIRIAAAMGCEVTAISTSPNKMEIAKKIGATHFVVSSDPESVKARAKTLDLILNTVSANHQVMTYQPLLKTDGTIVLIGVTTDPHIIHGAVLLFNRQSIAGSLIGGIKETQECIDFCAKHNIKPAIELVKSDKLAEVYTSLSSKNDSITRYVLDIEMSLKSLKQ